MNQHGVLVLVSGILQPGLAWYALRLNRVFGSRHVGWWVFWTFVCLALLHVLHFVQLAGVPVGLVDIFITVLLLVGMAHIESFCAGRVWLETKERELSAQAESVSREAAEMASANKNLLQQLAFYAEREQALLSSVHQLDRVFQETPLPMWIFDPSSLRFLAANEAALRLYGFTAAELQDRTPRDLLYALEDLPDFQQLCSPSTSADNTPRFCRHRRKDGSVVDVEVMTTNILYLDCPARLVLARDVGGQHQQEWRLVEQGKEKAARQLAGRIGHFLIRLLAPISKGVYQLTQRTTPEDAEGAARLQEVSAAASSAAMFTRQLLAFSRAEPLRKVPLNLNDVLEKSMSVLRSLAGKDVELERTTFSDLPSIAADPGMIQQLFINLLLIARETMPHGGRMSIGASPVHVGEQETHASSAARAGDYVCLAVSGNGGGAAPEAEAPQSPSFLSTEDAVRVAGWGLAAVQAIAEQHSGWVEVTKEAGISEYKIFFPCSPVVESCASSSESLALAPATPLTADPSPNPAAQPEISEPAASADVSPDTSPASA